VHELKIEARIGSRVAVFGTNGEIVPIPSAGFHNPNSLLLRLRFGVRQARRALQTKVVKGLACFGDFHPTAFYLCPSTLSEYEI
jgi:hypothetical protein